MAANNLKNADRLEAGATITIPDAKAAAAQATPAAVTAFVTKFFSKCSAGDVNALIDDYDTSVTYYKKGKTGRDVVRQDKVDFFRRWPKRTYTPGKVTVTETTKSGTLRVSVPVRYTAAAGAKSTSGQAVFTFELRPEGGSYRIVEENSVVAKRK